MIDDLRAMAIFATVAETGSFSAAGRQLRLATSGISQHVTNLEDRLGVTLFYRSTRSLSLTNEGKRLLEHTQRMMTAAEDGLNSIVDISNEPAGALIITLPAFMAGSTYEQAIWSFTRQHQAVAVTIKYLDRNFDLVAEGIDLALRMGELPDSALRSRRLGSFGRKLVCAPSYLNTLPPVVTPDDLKNADFVAMEGLADQVALLKDGEEQVLHTGRGRVLVDNFAALRSALCAGLGIQRLPAIVADTDLKSGALAEILPDWKIPDLGTYGVWPDTSRRSSLTRLLIDYIIAKT
ncbi:MULTISPECIES: LysR family transcriptional regulator [unclassified Ruegeria]|uniref:LysR family transcriptional regulator n=1 Tax=unclassified Ruegeria TaxID=2625375 RepID=UPI0014925BA3|nr:MULTISPECIES: LysR family transcriptional regulator [unclassified Ruegeria]NOD85570.1 LysR family transcriptional regulator [Ruegeria sp. HKCCD6119]